MEGMKLKLILEFQEVWKDAKKTTMGGVRIINILRQLSGFFISM